MKFIVNTLLNNDYPIDFIFNTINSRLKMLFHKLRTKGNSVDSDTTNEERPLWFVHFIFHPCTKNFLLL